MSRAIEMDSETLASLLRGDPRCSIELGARVEKVKSYESAGKEEVAIGSRGDVCGSMYKDDPKTDEKEMYLVKFDILPYVVLTMGGKLKQI